jgi:hypothetical protein
MDCRTFEGQSYEKQEISTFAPKTNKAGRRKERVVMVRGHAVAKHSISTESWTAIPTFTGTEAFKAMSEARTAERKGKRKVYEENQNVKKK